MAGDSQRTGSPLGALGCRRPHIVTPAVSRPESPRRIRALVLVLWEAPSVELVDCLF